MDVLEAMADGAMSGRFESALRVVTQSLGLFGEAGVAISFNGGKDSTVLLHLLRAALALRAKEAGETDGGAGRLRQVRCIHFRSNDEFPEMEAFLHATIEEYQLNFHSTDAQFKAGLAAVCGADESGRTAVRAILMGQRRTDPHCAHLSVFTPTDTHKGWPLFMRVNALLDWEYADVWSFLLLSKVKYCCLYNEGYTSLGGVSTTARHPALVAGSSAAAVHERTSAVDSSLGGSGPFLPAYMLPGSEVERQGRVQPEALAKAT